MKLKVFFVKQQLAAVFFVMFLCLLFIAEGLAQSPKNIALFFAAKDYENWPDLRNPIKDAYTIAGELEKYYAFETEIVENPTLTDVLGKLRAYRQKTYAEDQQLFIFFSGHGDFMEGTKEGFFIPSDAAKNDLLQQSYIPHSRLKRAITTIPCRHILLAIDACYSGTFDDQIALQKNGSDSDFEDGDSTMQQAYIRQIMSLQSRLYLTSGGKERTSDGVKHSPYTIRFLEALDQRVGLLDFERLSTYMEKADPVPRTGQFEGHESGGDFLLIPVDNPILMDEAKEDRLAWERVKAVDDPDAYYSYLMRFPQGQFTDQAMARRDEFLAELKLKLEDSYWKMARVNNTEAAIEDYLLRYAEGVHRDSAFLLIEALKEAKKQSEANKRTYKTVSINGKIWMQENLNYDIGEGCWCFYETTGPCEGYGRLYTWDAAVLACEALGNDWRLPTADEWKELAKLAGGYIDVGLKWVGDAEKGYKNLRKEGKKEFAAQLGGSRWTSGFFGGTGGTGTYWSAGQKNVNEAWYFLLDESLGKIMLGAGPKGQGYSCRCIKDN